MALLDFLVCLLTTASGERPPQPSIVQPSSVLAVSSGPWPKKPRLGTYYSCIVMMSDDPSANPQCFEEERRLKGLVRDADHEYAAIKRWCRENGATYTKEGCVGKGVYKCEPTNNLVVSSDGQKRPSLKQYDCKEKKWSCRYSEDAEVRCIEQTSAKEQMAEVLWQKCQQHQKPSFVKDGCDGLRDVKCFPGPEFIQSKQRNSVKRGEQGYTTNYRCAKQRSGNIAQANGMSYCMFETPDKDQMCVEAKTSYSDEQMFPGNPECRGQYVKEGSCQTMENEVCFKTTASGLDQGGSQVYWCATWTAEQDQRYFSGSQGQENGTDAGNGEQGGPSKGCAAGAGSLVTSVVSAAVIAAFLS